MIEPVPLMLLPYGLFSLCLALAKHWYIYRSGPSKRPGAYYFAALLPPVLIRDRRSFKTRTYCFHSLKSNLILILIFYSIWLVSNEGKPDSTSSPVLSILKISQFKPNDSPNSEKLIRLQFIVPLFNPSYFYVVLFIIHVLLT